MTIWLLRNDLEVAASATDQMVADLAQHASVLAGGPPVLRLYRWHPPALSLGRNQDLADVDQPACARHGVDLTRRPTGGRALLHGGDLTYAVAMRIPEGLSGVLEAYAYLARGLAAGLARIGVDADVARRDGERGLACFASAEGADLAVAGRKVCGSAQLQRDGVLLQHGSILLERLPIAEPDLLRYHDEAQRAREVQRLHAATVTLAELGAPTDARVVAEALVSGFADALGARFNGAGAGEPGAFPAGLPLGVPSA